MSGSDKEGNSELRRDARFPATQWSVVLAARDAQSDIADPALTILCSRYWYPLYAYARRLGKTPEQAEDLTQAFFAKLLAKNYLDAANPAKGRLRTFLLTAFKRFLANEWDKEHAQKRGGGERPLSIDADRAEEWYVEEPADPISAEKLYEQQWALNMLNLVLDRLQALYDEGGKGAVFTALKPTIMAGEQARRYVEIAEQLGMQESAIKVAAHRLRKQYRNHLRAYIAETVDSEDEIEAEIRQLFAAFSN